MAKPFRLSPRAEVSMADIGAWTVGRFGDQQAERYLETLISRCTALSDGRIPHRSCRDRFASDLRDDLRFISARPGGTPRATASSPVLALDAAKGALFVLAADGLAITRNSPLQRRNFDH